MNNNNSLHRSSTRRRPSVIDIVTSKFNEEKSLLAAKTPNIISKRRGSTVSIDSIQSNSRRNSIVMIDSITTTSTTSSSSSSTALLREITTTTTTLISEIILSQPMNTDEFITKSSDFSSSKLHFPPPPPPPPLSEYDENVRDVFDDYDDGDDYIFSDDDLKSYNKKHVKTLSQHAQRHHLHHHSRSLSSPSVIPSLSSQRPLIPSINYDNHNEYKQRTINSSIKLNKFFGDKPPLDICVKEIEKEGLKAMLHSKIPLCYFLYSLLEEYSCENLVSIHGFFYIIVFFTFNSSLL